eukprot:gene2843-3288_t
MENGPFKFVLTDKLLQDHIELLFSFIQSKEGWNNNPNVLQLKYALRNMILRNKITASNNANCHVFEQNTIIPVFKNNVSSNMERDGDDESTILYMIDNIDKSEFRENTLFYILGYIVSKLVKNILCENCQDSQYERGARAENSLAKHCMENAPWKKKRYQIAFILLRRNNAKLPIRSVEILAYWKNYAPKSSLKRPCPESDAASESPGPSIKATKASASCCSKYNPSAIATGNNADLANRTSVATISKNAASHTLSRPEDPLEPELDYNENSGEYLDDDISIPEQDSLDADVQALLTDQTKVNVEDNDSLLTQIQEDLLIEADTTDAVNEKLAGIMLGLWGQKLAPEKLKSRLNKF